MVDGAETVLTALTRDIQSIAIILRIADDRVAEFEAMFAAEEIPIWDDFTAQGF